MNRFWEYDCICEDLNPSIGLGKTCVCKTESDDEIKIKILQLKK